MTKGAAMQAFFEKILPSYATAAVPEDVTFPYLTYDSVFDAWGGEPVSITVNLWFYSKGEAEPNKKALELSQALGIGGAVLPCDEGFIWLRRGSPFCQAIKDDTNDNIKRRYCNITAEFLCQN